MNRYEALLEAREKEKAELLKSCEEEEKNKQEMIVSLLDSISKYKETMDVGFGDGAHV